ncbi:hypothetical protein BLOT_013406 [Blomia tropicalis]|nr:hypothetical protein BLOT_013406 [Blomia tropicalis]
MLSQCNYPIIIIISYQKLGTSALYYKNKTFGRSNVFTVCSTWLRLFSSSCSFFYRFSTIFNVSLFQMSLALRYDFNLQLIFNCNTSDKKG